MAARISASATMATPVDADRRADILLQVTESMISASSLDVALNRLAWLALKATGADRAAILVRDGGDPPRLIPTTGAATTGDLSILWKRFRWMEPIELTDEQGRASVLGAREVATFEDAQASPIVPREWLETWGSSSIAYARISSGEEMFGALAVDYIDTRHTFDESEVKLLHAIAGAAGVALRGAQLVDRLKNAVAIERRLSESSVRLRAERPLHEMLDVVAESFVALLPGASCAVMLASPDGKSLRPAAHRGIPPLGDVILTDLPADLIREVRARWAEDPRKPIVISDVTSQARYEGFVPQGIGTGMIFCLPENPEMLGMICVGRGHGPFTDDEVRIATTFADHAALAIARCRLTEMLQLRLNLIEAQQRLSDAVARTSDLRSVMTALDRKVCRDLGVGYDRLTFGDSSLAKLLGVPAATDEERSILRGWRRTGERTARVHGRYAVSVPVHGRPVGLLWAKDEPTDVTRMDLLRAIAVGIGEVAFKAKLRLRADQRNRDLAVARDRERIAKDLHDTVGQTLYAIGLKLQNALFEIEEGPLRDQLASARALASQGVNDVRSAVYALSFLHVRERGFLPSLKALCRQFQLVTKVPARLTVSGALPALHPDTEAALYRVAHEALVNVDRHARASGVVINLTASDGQVALTIRDDGVGLDQRDTANWRSAAHFGMRSMASSVREVGGEFDVHAIASRGLLIRASVPSGW